MLAALESAGVPVGSVTVARPSLDDVYLRYTGRRFDQAEPARPTEADQLMTALAHSGYMARRHVRTCCASRGGS